MKVAVDTTSAPPLAAPIPVAADAAAGAAPDALKPPHIVASTPPAPSSAAVPAEGTQAAEDQSERELSPAEQDAIATFQANTERATKATTAFDDEVAESLATYMLHPFGVLRQRWDMMSIVLIAYNALAIPFQMTFSNGTDPSMEAVDWSIDVFFLLDLVVNFFTGVDVDGRVEFDRKFVASNYLRTWFFIDLVSAFPWSAVLPDEEGESVSQLPQLAKFFKIFRLVRLARMFRLMRIINRLEYALLIRSTISSIFKFAAVVCLASHWFSCVFFALGQSAPDENNWIDANGLNEDGVTVYDQYVAAFYWSIMTMTTVGFGDLVAESVYERLFSVFAMIFGALIFAYGITNVVALVANLNHEERKFREKMDRVNEYMAARELPAELRQRIREHFYGSRNSIESRLSNEQEILDEISSLLRSKVALSINDQFLRQLTFFAESHSLFIMELALSMRLAYYPPFEDVVSQGEKGSEMFFIFRGAVEVVQDGKKKCVLAENDYFGEACMLHPSARRTATVRTVMFCELRSLSSDKFMHALQSYPDEQARVSELLRVPVEAIEAAKRRHSHIMPSIADVSEGRGGVSEGRGGDFPLATTPVGAGGGRHPPASRYAVAGGSGLGDSGGERHDGASSPRSRSRSRTHSGSAADNFAECEREQGGDSSADAGIADVLDLLHSVIDEQQRHSSKLQEMTEQLVELEQRG